LALYRSFFASPVAYVALDINPSVELGVNRQERVVEVMTLNGDAGQLVAGVKLKGRPVKEAVALLIGRAAELGYINRQREGVVLLTVLPARENAAAPPAAVLAKVAIQVAEQRNLPVKVVATAVPAAYRKEAHRLGLSPGRYTLKVGAARAGKPLTLEELRHEGLGRLEVNRRVRVEALVRANRLDKVVVVPARLKQSSVRKKEVTKEREGEEPSKDETEGRLPQMDKKTASPRKDEADKYSGYPDKNGSQKRAEKEDKRAQEGLRLPTSLTKEVDKPDKLQERASRGRKREKEKPKTPVGVIYQEQDTRPGNESLRRQENHDAQSYEKKHSSENGDS